MGVDAKALLTQDGLSPLDVLIHLDSLPHVKKANITSSSIKGFVYINFDWYGEQRCMAVFYDDDCSGDYEEVYPFPAILCSIGCWGFSDAIVVALKKNFGGFYLLNDCSGEWRK